jgi:hypothetical protein
VEAIRAIKVEIIRILTAIYLDRLAISSYSFEDFIIAIFRLIALEAGAVKKSEEIAAKDKTDWTEPNKAGPPIRPINTLITKVEIPWLTLTINENVPAEAIDDWGLSNLS